jgi:hypothetical protein
MKVKSFVYNFLFRLLVSCKFCVLEITGLASPSENYRTFYAERNPWWLVIKATGPPGHGAKLYDNSAMENLLKSVESIRRFRASQFDLVKAGLKAEGEVFSVNTVFVKAGTPSPTVSWDGILIFLVVLLIHLGL